MSLSLVGTRSPIDLPKPDGTPPGSRLGTYPLLLPARSQSPSSTPKKARVPCREWSRRNPAPPAGAGSPLPAAAPPTARPPPSSLLWQGRRRPEPYLRTPPPPNLPPRCSAPTARPPALPGRFSVSKAAPAACVQRTNLSSSP